MGKEKKDEQDLLKGSPYRLAPPTMLNAYRGFFKDADKGHYDTLVALFRTQVRAWKADMGNQQKQNDVNATFLTAIREGGGLAPPASAHLTPEQLDAFDEVLHSNSKYRDLWSCRDANQTGASAAQLVRLYHNLCAGQFPYAVLKAAADQYRKSPANNRQAFVDLLSKYYNDGKEGGPALPINDAQLKSMSSFIEDKPLSSISPVAPVSTGY